MHLTGDNPAHQPGRMHAALAHVEMRALLIGDQYIRHLDNLWRNVAVKVVRQDEGNVAAESSSNAPRRSLRRPAETLRCTWRHAAPVRMPSMCGIARRPSISRGQSFEGLGRDSSLGVAKVWIAGTMS